MKFVHGVVAGLVVGMMICGIMLVRAEKNSWNMAIRRAQSRVVESNQFAGLDQTYDLGYQRCQDKIFERISELKSE